MRAEVKKAGEQSEYFFEEGCHILEVANDDGDAQVSIARARVPAGITTAWHRLEDISERYLVISGRGRVEIGDLDAAEVGPGDVVRIPPGCRQRITSSGQEDLVFYAICSPRFQPGAYVSLD